MNQYTRNKIMAEHNYSSVEPQWDSGTGQYVITECTYTYPEFDNNVLGV